MRTKVGVASVLAILALLAWLLLFPSIKFSAAQKKYPLGMHLDQAMQIAVSPIEILSGGPVFPDGDPTGEGKRSYAFYNIYNRKEGVLLEFNYYSNLIAVIPLDSPIDSWRCKLSRKPRG